MGVLLVIVACIIAVAFIVEFAAYIVIGVLILGVIIVAIIIAKWLYTEHGKAIKKENVDRYGYWQFVRLGKTVETRAENQFILKIITKGHLIIDTCVWMAGEEFDCFYEDLFDVLQENGGKITISADILDELSRLKTDSNTKKRTRARRGLTRIEKFQNDGLIKTCGVKKVANPKAYADKSIIDFFMKSDNSSLLTFDKELRIRLTAKLEEQKITNARQILTIRPTKYNDCFQSKECL